MKILIETVPKEECRNDECGDWSFNEDGSLRVLVANMPWKSALAVAVHEAVEAMLCQEAGVTDLQVTQWDFHFNALRMSGARGLHEESGDDVKAPYHKQHAAATAAERMVVASLGLTWEQHEQNIYESCD